MLIKLDTRLGWLNSSLISFNQLSVGTSKLEFEITENNQPKDLTDLRVMIEIKTPSGSIQEEHVTIIDAVSGKIEKDLSAPMLTEEGSHYGELSLYSQDNTKLLCTHKFRYIVGSNYGEQGAKQTSQYATLQTCIMEVKGLEKEVGNNIEEIEISKNLAEQAKNEAKQSKVESMQSASNSIQSSIAAERSAESALETSGTLDQVVEMAKQSAEASKQSAGASQASADAAERAKDVVLQSVEQSNAASKTANQASVNAEQALRDAIVSKDTAKQAEISATTSANEASKAEASANNSKAILEQKIQEIETVKEAVDSTVATANTALQQANTAIVKAKEISEENKNITLQATQTAGRAEDAISNANTANQTANQKLIDTTEQANIAKEQVLLAKDEVTKAQAETAKATEQATIATTKSEEATTQADRATREADRAGAQAQEKVNNKIGLNGVHDDTIFNFIGQNGAITQLNVNGLLYNFQGQKGEKGDPGTASVAINDTVINEQQTWSSEKIKQSINTSNEKIKTQKINISAYNNSQLRPLVTFISDDGNREDLKMLSLFNSKQVKACTAMISNYIGRGNYMTADELKRLHEAGWDIMLHDTSHRYMNTLTEEELNTAMKVGKETIEALGIPCRGLATPYGATNSLVKRVAEKYFDYAFGENIGRINNQPIISYDLERVNHGSNGQTMTHYQNAVKNAINTNGWCVFCTHYYQLTEEQRVEMGELIDWIKLQGVDIVTVSEAMNIFGNVQEYRNYDTDEYFAVSRSGKTFANGINGYTIKSIGTINNNTPITEFDYEKTTIMNFNNSELGFPVKAGTLETYRDKYTDFNTYCYQKITPVFGNNNNLYYRQWDKSNKAWKPWNSIGMNVGDRLLLDAVNSKTSTSLITEFTSGKVTYTVIGNSNKEGFPENLQGLLETNRMHSADIAYQYQKYYIYGSDKIYYRNVKFDGRWSEWRKVIVATKITRSVIATSVPANTTIERTISAFGANYDSMITAIPKGELPQGIFFNTLINSNLNNINIRFVNVTSQTINIPEMDWTIHIS